MARIGPVEFTAINDEYTQAARIASFVWVGTTVDGNQVIIRERTTEEIMWQCITGVTRTYLGIDCRPFGIHSLNGFYAHTLDNGKVLIYLLEE